MLVNSFNPFDNLVLSSIIAAIPIILFLLCLTVFKMKGIYAAVTTLVVTLLIAIPKVSSKVLFLLVILL